jgi:hypothetical protein
MTTFDIVSQQALESLMAVHSVPVVYTPHSGSAVTIRGIFTGLGQNVDVGGESLEAVTTGSLKVSKADVPGPDDRDQVSINGEVWAVDRVISHGPVLVVLGLIKQELRQVGGAKGIIR